MRSRRWPGEGTLTELQRNIAGNYSSRSHLVRRLVFADEALELLLVLVWGRLADMYGPRTVVVASNVIVGTALFLFVEAKSVFPQLLLVSCSARLMWSEVLTIGVRHTLRRG